MKDRGVTTAGLVAVVLSVDGHVVEVQFPFTVRSAQ
jgi:methionine-rich copper-binding protein CopC